jgi:hypothetical protein
VADLEAALADVQAALADESAETDSSAADATESATASVAQLVTSGGQPTKVIGRLNDDQGIGVLGEATASSTPTYGVEGITQSSDNDAAGVRASAPNGGIGLVAEADGNRAIEVSVTDDDAVEAKTNGSAAAAAVFGTNTAASGQAWGVRGDTASTGDNAFGVRGEALDGSGAAKGVAGFTYGEDDGAAGVYGKSRGTSGFVHGVKGETDSPAGYGLYTPDDARVGGSIDIRNVGVSAYLSTNQTIDSGPTTTVEFDETIADHFDGLDTPTGVYTIPEAGDYHVSFTVNWVDSFDADVEITYDLSVGDATSFQGIELDTTTTRKNQEVTQTASRTLFDLTPGDPLGLSVSQDSGSQKTIDSGRKTYLTVHKVG